MKVLIQRVSSAEVSVARETLGAIERGLLLLIGMEQHDTLATVQRMADKVSRYRVFADEAQRMNLSVMDVGGGVLAVSQFTLAADTRKGLRPGFSRAASPEQAEQLYEAFVQQLKMRVDNVQTGRFGADMAVALTNDGPVTFLLEL